MCSCVLKIPRLAGNLNFLVNNVLDGLLEWKSPFTAPCSRYHYTEAVLSIIAALIEIRDDLTDKAETVLTELYKDLLKSSSYDVIAAILRVIVILHTYPGDKTQMARADTFLVQVVDRLPAAEVDDVFHLIC